ncbi:MAG: hypothetical protein M3X11_00150 [Acidobacteriota bacterium]|nr:hypothetical protein [Acidobacteriota bacterium]
MPAAIVTTEIEETIVEKLRKLPLEKQREAPDFVELLEQKITMPHLPRRSLKGSLAHLNVHVTAEDIHEARREMWANFPREKFFESEEKR